MATALSTPSNYWLDNCKREPEKYRHCILNIDHTGKMFAIDKNTRKHFSITCARQCVKAFDKDGIVIEVLGSGNVEIKYVFESHFNPCLQAIVCKLDHQTSGPKMVPRNKALPIFKIRGVKDSTYLKTRFMIYDKESLEAKGSVEISMTDRLNALFVVRHLKWNTNCFYPLGCVIERLPPGDSLERGLKILSLEHNLNLQNNWSEPVQKELQDNMKFNENWQIPETEIDDRLDLTKECVFTIDRTDANELDDALSITKLSDGHYKVGIHIADVSYFVEKGSTIDIEARKICISLNPPSAKPIRMIPKENSSNFSLIPEKDRLAISVILKIDEEGCVVKDETDIKRSIVHSCRRFSYEEVEQIIQKLSIEYDEKLANQIRWFNELATKRRKIRLKSGGFCYEHNDVTDDLDCPLAKSLVEESMLLANEVVAALLTKAYPKCVPLKRQLPPKLGNMQEWIQKFHGPIKNSLEMSAKISELPGDSPSIMSLTKDIWNKLEGLLNKKLNKDKNTPISEHKDFLKIIDLVANDMLHPQLMLMKLKHYNIQYESDYVCSGRDDARHHSLSLERYTNFTSPIRKYIDLVVHRLLVAALKNDKEPPYMSEDIEDICDNMNEKALNKKRFYQRTKDFVLALNLKKKVPFLINQLSTV